HPYLAPFPTRRSSDLRAGVPRHHPPMERPGDSGRAADEPIPARLLLLLEGRSVHPVRGLREGAATGPHDGQMPFRRRALLAGLRSEEHTSELQSLAYL